MLKGRKENLLKLINLEIGKVKLSTENSNTKASNIREYSLPLIGDKYHAESTVELAQEYYQNLVKLREEINNCSDDVSKLASPVSYVELNYKSGESINFYLVIKGALLPGVLIITSNSPIGKAVRGKKEGDSFSYQIDTGGGKTEHSGVVQKVE